jgi:MFS family permease
MIDHLPLPKLHVYAISFAAAGIAGYVSSWYLALIPEPAMVKLGPPVSVWSKVRAPFGDANFRPLLVFMGAWNGISNLAAPFLSVYLMKQLGYSVGTVTTMWVASQIANALTLYSWGRLSDRLSNKAILAAALPAYFLCMLGLVFTAMPASATARLAALYALHVVMGAAGGGIGLATGNIGLKLAPQGEGTAYLSTISMVNSIAGGIAPIVGGALAQAFAASHLSVFVQWVSIANVRELAVVHVTHWQFLFALSFILGFYVLHTLSRVREGQEISQRAVIQEIGLEAMRTVNQMSSIAGLTGGLVWFGRAVERRLWWRHGGAPPAESTGEPPARKRVSATGGPAAS